MNITHSKKKTIMSYIVITFGIFLYTFGWSAFLIPSQIIGGGVSGMSSIIFFISGESIPVGITNLVINAILFLIALKLLGAKFGLNTIYGILVSSGFFILLQQGIEIQNLLDITKFDPFMCAIIGGGLAGAGIGLAFTMGGNSGGTDIVALIINKYYNISPGKVIMYLDIVIIGCSFFVSHEIENVVYGYVQMAVMTYALDLVIDGSKQSYQIMVFSQFTKDIADRIGNEVGRGVTLLNGWGWFSKSDQKVLLVIARKVDKQLIMEIIQNTDPKAFISVAKVQGVYGKNFEKLKL
ncbi:MAG: YitT family protein [Bacteroidales bacterium]|nr:YitT family protein [Bacteroidales bacterium]MBR5778267.1 YitT family protein [Bacteroidales bacterium]